MCGIAICGLGGKGQEGEQGEQGEQGQDGWGGWGGYHFFFSMDFLVYILSTLMGYMCFVIPKRNISKQPTPKKKPI